MTWRRTIATLTIVTPTFIGDGGSLSKMHYVCDGKVVKIVDDRKLARFLANLKPNGAAIDEFAKSGGLYLTPYRDKDIFAYALAVIDATENTRQRVKPLNEIKTFVKSPNGKPYIPGSSLKGAMRTAILRQYIVRNKIEGYRGPDDIKALEKKAFGDIGQDIFKNLSIADSSESEIDTLFVARRFDQSTHKEEPSPMPIFCEFLYPQTAFTFAIDFDDAVFSLEKNASKFSLKPALDNLLASRFAGLLKKPFAEKGDFFVNDANLCLGGQSGYFFKSVVYDFFGKLDEPANRQKAIAAVRDGAMKKCPHKHKHDTLDKEISPHTLKIAKTSNSFKQIGLGKIEFSAP